MREGTRNGSGLIRAEGIVNRSKYKIFECRDRIPWQQIAGLGLESTSLRPSIPGYFYAFRVQTREEPSAKGNSIPELT